MVHGDGMDVIAENIPTMAKVVLEKVNILFAIPCIENAYDETCIIEAIPADKILEREPELLKIAFANMPKLIVGEADVLVVDDLLGKGHSLVKGSLERAEGALNGDVIAFCDLYRNACGKRNGHSTNS